MQAIDRWDLLRLVKACRPELNKRQEKYKIGDRELAVLVAHLSVMPKGPLREGDLNMSYMEVSKLLERANCMDERKFRRAEVSLEKLGLIHRRLSANGRRFPVWVKGRIVDAYGVDLTPLVAMAGDLDDLSRNISEQSEAIQATKTRISARLSSIKRQLCEAGVGVCNRLVSFMQDVRNMTRRKTIGLSALEEIERRVKAFEQEVISGVADVTAVKTVETTQEHRGYREDPRHYAPRKMTGDDGQNVRHIESRRKEIQKKEKRDTDAKQFDAIAIAYAWDRTRTLRTVYEVPPATETAMARILYDLTKRTGIGEANILDILACMGWTNTVKTIDYIIGKLHTIAKPNMFIGRLLECYERGEAVAGGRVRRVMSPRLPQLVAMG